MTYYWKSCSLFRNYFLKTNIFSDGKMKHFKKQISETQLLDFLRADGGFPPLRIKIIETDTKANQTGGMIDALVEASWDNTRFIFAVEAKLAFNPKAIQDAANQIKAVAEQLNVNPLILTPYLADEQLRALEARRVSGIDLCGNGIIIIPGSLLVYRTGSPNKYPSRRLIRNVYRGASSIVARSFLLRSEYETAQELMDEIAARGGNLTLSTISKVCTSLADDLTIEREQRGRTTRFRLLQSGKLLNRLAESYRPPELRNQFTGKLNIDEKDFEKIAQDWNNDMANRVVRTGASSSDRYATMAREPICSYYCTDLRGIVQRLGELVRETDRFPNIRLSETDDPTVYFDIRDDFDASPIQAYLELNAGDKRERETAEQIRQRMLQNINGVQEAS